MRHLTSLILTAFLVLLLISCKKEIGSVDLNHADILGKWNVLNDSTFIGAGVNNHPINYIGQSGDYFDFRSDDNLYIKEGNFFDTLSYRQTSGTTIIITSFGATSNGVTEASSITNVTAHSVTITAPFILTPGGKLGREVNLIR